MLKALTGGAAELQVLLELLLFGKCTRGTTIDYPVPRFPKAPGKTLLPVHRVPVAICHTE